MLKKLYMSLKISNLLVAKLLSYKVTVMHNFVTKFGKISCTFSHFTTIPHKQKSRWNHPTAFYFIHGVTTYYPKLSYMILSGSTPRESK